MSNDIVIFDDEENEIRIKTKYEVCPRCWGEGRHTNPSIDGNGITQSEMDELGEDFAEDYFSGAYDVLCEECKGNRVVSVPDKENNTKETLAAYDDYEYEKYQDREMHRMEMMAEYGMEGRY